MGKIDKLKTALECAMRVGTSMTLGIAGACIVAFIAGHTEPNWGVNAGKLLVGVVTIYWIFRLTSGISSWAELRKEFWFFRSKHG